MQNTPREYRDEFSDRVKEARENAGFTQETMARLLKVSQPTYSKYEGGRGADAPSLMPHYMLSDFATICRVSVDWLLTGTGGDGVASFRKPRKRMRKSVA